MSELLLTPKDIQVEIFLKLPVNSILACKCVCKLWRKFLSNPQFLKNHLNLSNQKNERKVMVSRYHQFEGFRPKLFCADYASISKSLSQSFPWNESVVVEFPFYDYRRFGRVEILGSCNGLICLRVSGARPKYENNVICIWNPSTREYKKVPEVDSRFNSACSGTRYGFGYHCVKGDYKLVRINNNKSYSRYDIHVYRLRYDKWYRTGTRQTRIRYSFPYERKSDGLLFNGALHWLGILRATSTEVIVLFNLNNDKLVDMPLPAAPMPYPEAKQYKNLGVLEDCLCLVFVVPRVSIDVWVMKDYGLRDSWTKQFTIVQNAESIIDFPFWKPILVFKNGDILADTTWQSVVCDPEEGSVRKVCNSFLDGTTVMDSVSYVESLVSLNSGKYVLPKNKKKRRRTTEEYIGQIVETQGKKQAFEEDEEVATSQLGLEDTSFSKPTLSKRILVKSKKVESKSTGMFPSGTLSTKKKTSQKPKVPNKISTTELVEFGSQWGSPCGGTLSRRV